MHILIDELEALNGGSVADLVAINTRSAFEDVNHRYLLPRLRQALAQQRLSSIEQDAVRTLFDWDKSWRVDNSGFYGPANALMEAFVRLLQAQIFLDDVGGDQYFRFAATNYPNNPLGASLGTSVAIRALVHWLDIAESGGAPPYDLLNGAALEDVLVLSFREAVAELTTDQGADPLKWQLKAAPMVWRSVNFRGVPQADPANTVSLPGYQNRGSENNVFVATGTGIEGRDVIPPGQGGHWMASGEPSPHRSDQFKLYADFAYKPLPFHREAVAAAAKTVRELRVIHPR